VNVRGVTAAERQLARAKRTSERRVQYYATRISTATHASQQLAHACDYLRAVAKGLPEVEIRLIAKAVVEIADRKNVK